LFLIEDNFLLFLYNSDDKFNNFPDAIKGFKHTIMAGQSSPTDRSYESVVQFAREHYENFPVVSFLVPKEFRKDIAVIYWFARTADDIADEGEFAPGERLEMLERYEDRFKELLRGNFESKNEELLYNTIQERNLSVNNFTDLLSAFKQDVVKKRYDNYAEILDYCRRSANPVGRLLLELFNYRRKEMFSLSDNICTALQLTNFLQDTSLDYEKGRIYLAKDEIDRFSVTEQSFEMKEINDNLRRLVEFNIVRIEDLFSEGKKLLPLLEGRFKYEIKWTIEGGLTILRRIRNNNFNIFDRPHLSKYTAIGILIKSLFR